MFVACSAPFSRRRILFLVPGLAVLAVLTLVNVLGFADTSKPATSAKAKRGDALFHKQCVSCHNKQVGDTTPFGPPNLHGIFQNSTLTPVQAESIIKGGRNAMPAFGNMLTNSQIDDLIAYLKTQ